MRRESYRGPWSMTTILLVVNVVCFLVQSALSASGLLDVYKYLALSVWGLKHGLVYQLITFQFLHGSFIHLFFNMWAIFMFGRAVESQIGGRNFLILYFLSGSFGGLVQTGFGFMAPNLYGHAVVGASAGACGLVAAFATYSPDARIGLFFLPITFAAKYLIVIEAVFGIIGVLRPTGNVAHAAHLGGMIAGGLFAIYLRRSYSIDIWPKFRREPKRELINVPQAKRSPWKTASPQEEELPPEQFISKEVDPILDKISAHGIQSLTDREKQILEAARKKMSKR